MIRFFALHPTAANLLMVAFVVVGVIALPGLLRETFPRITPKKVQVSVAYPGAAPEEVSRAICRPIEDSLDSVQNVAELHCAAQENRATATVKMVQGAKLDQFFQDIQTEVEAITDLPESAENPVVIKLGRTDFVASLAITGSTDPTQLKALAERVKERMLAWGGIPLVEIKGFSQRQIRIEITDAEARLLGLSLEEIAQAIARQNISLPAGEIISPAGSTAGDAE